MKLPSVLAAAVLLGGALVLVLAEPGAGRAAGVAAPGATPPAATASEARAPRIVMEERRAEPELEARHGERPAPVAPLRAAAPELPRRAAPVLAEGSSELPAQPGDLVSGPLLRGFYEDGQLHFEGHEVLGADGRWLREGPWEAWHPNGALHELGAYRDDQEHGPWSWWYEDGTRMAQGRFVEGRREGEWTFWHENGHLMMHARYAGGKGTGHWLSFHANGIKQAEGDYVNGELGGYWSFWEEAGAVDPERTGFYADGEKVRD